MLAPKITGAVVAGPDALRVTFADGSVRLFNVRKYLSSPFFAALGDPAYLARVRVVDGTVTWPDGQDFDRGTIHALGAPGDGEASRGPLVSAGDA